MALLKSGTRIYGNAIIDTNLSIDGTTVASDYQTGALVVKGGVGIAGNVFINANLSARDALITGNLTVTGTTTTVNSSTTQLVDPVIDIGGGANGAALTTDDGLARGLALNYYNVGSKTAFLGWDNANTQFAFASNVSNTTGTLIINTYGDVKANSFNGALLGTANITALTVTGITRLGNVGNVKITGGTPNYLLQTDGQGNLTWVAPATSNAAGLNTYVQFNNANAFGASANFTFDSSSNTLTVDKITANGAGLTSIAGANVTGFVPNANISNTAYSVGGGNVSGQVGNALIAGTVYTNAQPNITSVGNLSSLTVDNGVYGNVVTTQYASVFASGKGPNPYSIMQVRSNDNASGIGMQAFPGSGTLYGNTVINFALATIRDNDIPSSLVTKAYIDSNGLSVTGNITSTNANLGNLATANYFTGNGSSLSSITGANVTGQVSNALVAGTVYTNAQPNITSVGNLSNLTVGNATSNVVLQDGNVTATGNLNVTGNISAGYITANLAYASGLSGATATYVTSNITSIVAGSTITVVADYANASYPGGVFTIAQLGPVSLSATDVWTGGTSTANAYANYLASSVNTKDVNVTLSLSNATFSVQSSDSITIGGSSVTGANLLALNITGNGTYTIPNTYFSSSVQTTTTSIVSISLTTNRGVYTASGTTLTKTQPVAFTVNALTGSFPNSTVPYFSLNQSFNWSASVTGTISSGNITYSGGVISPTSLTSSGATNGSSTSIDSTSSYTITTSDYRGAGLYGYGTRTIPSIVNGTISAATKYYPVFYKITSSATPPTLTTSDTYVTHNYVAGDGATTSNNTSEYLWIAVPGVASHTFAYTFLGSPVGQDPAVTSSQTISGYSYNIYGFTNFSVATFLYTVT
jgi:hypothetical protein